MRCSSTIPGYQFSGHPLVGEGALRYAAMGVLFAAAIILRRDALRFRLLLVCLLVESIGGTGAVFLWVRADFVSLDIAGILAVSAWVGAWCLMPEKWGVWRFPVCAVAIAPVLIMSTSDMAIVSTVLIGLPTSVLIYLNLKKPFLSVSRTRVIAASALVLIPFAGLLAVWFILLLTEALPSITSRKYIYQLVFAALRAEPSIFFVGQGWGEIVMTLDRFRDLQRRCLGGWQLGRCGA